MIKNELYTKHLYDISTLAKKLQNTLDSLSTDGETMEEAKIQQALYNASEALDKAKNAIEYFSKEAKEGKLRLLENDRFALFNRSGKELREFTCGCSIEVYLKADKEKYIQAGWYAGRVEYDNTRDGYYFYGANKPMLYEGMKARIRE